MARANGQDLRVQKTRSAIKAAFKQMVLEMNAADITVKELAERAMIHRKTFYLHYPAIEALYEDILHDLAEAYYREIDALPPDAPFTEVNRVFFSFMAAQEPYMERMVCAACYRDFADKLFLTMLLHNRARHNPYAAYTQAQQNIINTFLSVGSANIYRRWVQDGKILSVEELTELSGRLLTHGIEAIL